MSLDTEALTVVLKVTRVEVGDTWDFDAPDAIARASEGFCPFPTHYGLDDVISHEPVPVIPQADGTILCSWGAEHGREATLMSYEWFSTGRLVGNGA